MSRGSAKSVVGIQQINTVSYILSNSVCDVSKSGSILRCQRRIVRSIMPKVPSGNHIITVLLSQSIKFSSFSQISPSPLVSFRIDITKQVSPQGSNIRRLSCNDLGSSQSWRDISKIRDQWQSWTNVNRTVNDGSTSIVVDFNDINSFFCQGNSCVESSTCWNYGSGCICKLVVTNNKTWLLCDDGVFHVTCCGSC